MNRKAIDVLGNTLLQKCRSHYCNVILITLCVLLSRVILHGLGIRFYMVQSDTVPHLLPFDILTGDLMSGLWNLHIQPPLFNFLVGVVLKLSSDPASVFQFLYFVLTLLLAVSLYFLMVELHAAPLLSALATILFMAGPSTILFGNFLFYTLPLTVFLCLAALFLARFLRRGKALDGVLAFSFLAVPVLTRSTFHPAWFVCILCAAMIAMRASWKKVLLVSLAPLLAVVCLYGKNLVLFGSFTGSSWMGMSLSKMTTFALPERERIDLVRDGILSELALIPPFNYPWRYRENFTAPPKTGVPALDRGAANMNNIAMIGVSRQYLADAVTVLKMHPGLYLRSVARAICAFSFPSSDWFVLSGSENRRALYSYERLYNIVLQGQASLLFRNETARNYQNTGYMRNPANLGFLIPAGFLAAIFLAVRSVWSAYRRKALSLPRHGALIYLVFTMLFVFFVGNFFEMGENQRFRYMIDPYIVTVVVVFLSQMLQDRCAGTIPAPASPRSSRHRLRRSKP